MKWGTPRDPKRIDRILAKLATAWKQQPDTRLGQLIWNMSGRDDQFNLEDDEWERRIEKAGAA